MTTIVAKSALEALEWIKNGTAMPHYSATATGAKDKIIGIRKATYWERFKVQFVYSKEKISALSAASSIGFNVLRKSFDAPNAENRLSVEAVDSNNGGISLRGKERAGHLFDKNFVKLLRQGYFPLRDTNVQVSHEVEALGERPSAFTRTKNKTAEHLKFEELKTKPAWSKWVYTRVADTHQTHPTRRLVTSKLSTKDGHEAIGSGYCANRPVVEFFDAKAPRNAKKYVFDGVFSTIPESSQEIPPTEFPDTWKQTKLHFDKAGILQGNKSVSLQWTKLPRTEYDKKIGQAKYETTDANGNVIVRAFKLHEIVEQQPKNLILERDNGTVFVWALLEEQTEQGSRFRWYQTDFDAKGRPIPLRATQFPKDGVYKFDVNTPKGAIGWHPVQNPFEWVDNPNHNQAKPEKKVQFSAVSEKNDNVWIDEGVKSVKVPTARQKDSSLYAPDYQTQYKKRLQAGADENSRIIAELSLKKRNQGLNKEEVRTLQAHTAIAEEYQGALNRQGRFQALYHSSPVLVPKDDKLATPDQLRPRPELEKLMKNLIKTADEAKYQRRHTRENGVAEAQLFSPDFYQDENWKPKLYAKYFNDDIILSHLDTAIAHYASEKEFARQDIRPSEVGEGLERLQQLLPKHDYDGLERFYTENNCYIEWDGHEINSARLQILDENFKAHHAEFDDQTVIVQAQLNTLSTLKTSIVQSWTNQDTQAEARLMKQFRHAFMDLQNAQIRLETQAKTLGALQEFFNGTAKNIFSPDSDYMIRTLNPELISYLYESYPNYAEADLLGEEIKGIAKQVEEQLEQAGRIFAKDETLIPDESLNARLAEFDGEEIDLEDSQSAPVSLRDVWDNNIQFSLDSPKGGLNHADNLDVEESSSDIVEDGFVREIPVVIKAEESESDDSHVIASGYVVQQEPVEDELELSIHTVPSELSVDLPDTLPRPDPVQFVSSHPLSSPRLSVVDENNFLRKITATGSLSRREFRFYIEKLNDHNDSDEALEMATQLVDKLKNSRSLSEKQKIELSELLQRRIAELKTEASQKALQRAFEELNQLMESIEHVDEQPQVNRTKLPDARKESIELLNSIS